MLAAKSTDYRSINTAASVIADITEESILHTVMVQRWGVSVDELHSTSESRATMAYGQYLLDIGIQGQSSNVFFY